MTYPILSFYRVYFFKGTAKGSHVVCAESTQDAELTILRNVTGAYRINAVFIEALLFITEN